MRKTFKTLMEDYRILIWNAEDPIIKTKIEPFGYTTEKLDEGKSLYEAVETLAEAQRTEYAELYTTSRFFIQKRHEAEDNLNAMRKISKYAFRKNPKAFNILKLSNQLPDNFSDWQQIAMYFYKRLQKHHDWIILLSAFGITTYIISQYLAEIDELKTLQEVRQRETGDAQRSTLVRNAKFEELKTWYVDLRDLSKILFEDADAQYLEKLGILVRS